MKFTVSRFLFFSSGRKNLTDCPIIYYISWIACLLLFAVAELVQFGVGVAEFRREVFDGDGLSTAASDIIRVALPSGSAGPAKVEAEVPSLQYLPPTPFISPPEEIIATVPRVAPDVNNQV